MCVSTCKTFPYDAFGLILHGDLRQRHGGIDCEIRFGRFHAALHQVHTQHGHHSAIIGAQFDLRDTHFDAMLGSDLQQFGAQLGVRGEAAANDPGES